MLLVSLQTSHSRITCSRLYSTMRSKESRETNINKYASFMDSVLYIFFPYMPPARHVGENVRLYTSCNTRAFSGMCLFVFVFSLLSFERQIHRLQRT